jgi:hypothetical protein
MLLTHRRRHTTRSQSQRAFANRAVLSNGEAGLPKRHDCRLCPIENRLGSVLFAVPPFGR